MQKNEENNSMITQENQWNQPFQDKTWEWFNLAILR